MPTDMGERAVCTRYVLGWSARVYRRRSWHAIHCAVARLWLSFLRLLFRFGAWHASAPYSCRAYKKMVVELANALHPAVAVEVGCGLGDIISRVKAVERVGIDLDANVIRAARFLHWRGRWIQGDSSRVLQLQQRRIDCLIMVNWIHCLSPDELAALLLPLLPITRYLILDAIDADGPCSYRYKHDFGFLAAATQRVRTVRAPDEPRSFAVLEVLQ
jgi:SAM-dependent methyltransferase